MAAAAARMPALTELHVVARGPLPVVMFEVVRAAPALAVLGLYGADMDPGDLDALYLAARCRSSGCRRPRRSVSSGVGRRRGGDGGETRGGGPPSALRVLHMTTPCLLPTRLLPATVALATPTTAAITAREERFWTSTCAGLVEVRLTASRSAAAAAGGAFPPGAAPAFVDALGASVASGVLHPIPLLAVAHLDCLDLTPAVVATLVAVGGGLRELRLREAAGLGQRGVVAALVAACSRVRLVDLTGGEGLSLGGVAAWLSPPPVCRRGGDNRGGGGGGGGGSHSSADGRDSTGGRRWAGTGRGVSELYVAECGLPADGLEAVVTAALRRGAPLCALGFDRPLRVAGVRDMSHGQAQ
ncbi:hypothetical protein MMPV_006998 [Pyropia vietnamensis]